MEASPNRSAGGSPYLLDNSAETGMAFGRFFCYKRRVQFGPGISHLLGTEPETSWRLGHEFYLRPQRCESRICVYLWANACPFFIPIFSPYIRGELQDIYGDAGDQGPLVNQGKV